MKKLKYILTSILVMLAVCTPLMLTGCTKYYHIEAFVRGDGKGDVYSYIDNTNGGSGRLGPSLVGEITDASSDQNFKYQVGSTSSDYEVVYIKENGVEIYNVDEKNNKLQPNEYGYISCNIEKITKDIKIEVEFRLRTVYLEYWYKDESAESGYSPLQINSEVYKTEHKSGQPIALANGYDAFGFEFEYGSNKVKISNNIIKINYSSSGGVIGRLYTDKTEAELKEWIESLNG